MGTLQATAWGRRTQFLLPVLLTFVAVATLGWVAATPSTAIPVGIAVNEGPSMGPAMAGDVVLYADLGYDRVEEGDTIIYYNSWFDEYVHHRVVDDTSKGYVAQGDANDRPDVGYVTRENYVGAVVFRLG